MAIMKQWDGAAWVEVAAQEGVPSIQDTTSLSDLPVEPPEPPIEP